MTIKRIILVIYSANSYHWQKVLKWYIIWLFKCFLLWQMQTSELLSKSRLELPRIYLDKDEQRKE